MILDNHLAVPADPDAVFALLNDVERVAGCLPGYEKKSEWLDQMRAEGWRVHAAEGDVSEFDSCAEMFYNVRITGIPCNLMKFKIWLQTMQNQRPASDALVARINALPGLGLTRGTAPSTHFNTALACS